MIAISFAIVGLSFSLAYAQESESAPVEAVVVAAVSTEESVNLILEEPVIVDELFIEEVPTADEHILEETTPEEAPTPEEVAAPEETTNVSADVVAEVSAETSVVEQVVEAMGDTESNVASAAVSVSAPELSTDKADYHPGETATIFGKFFAAFQSVFVKVFGSDDNNEHYIESTVEVIADENGWFTTSYTLDPIYRPFYELVAYTIDGIKLAETWFRDAAVDAYDQCANDDGDGYASGDTGCRYLNGAINPSNSTYQEGDSTVQRISLNGFAPGSSHTITIQYGTTKQGKHGGIQRG